MADLTGAMTDGTEMALGEQSVQALRLIATVLGHDPTPEPDASLSWRERVVLTIACDALGLDDPVV
jgi:hypothetical protein